MEVKIENARIVLKDTSEYIIIKPRIKITNGEIRVTGIFEKRAFSDIEDFETKLGMRMGRHIVSESDLFSIKGNGASNTTILITGLNFENVWYDELRFTMFSYGELLESTPAEKRLDETILSVCFDGVDMIHTGISKIRVERHLNGNDFSYVKKYKNDFTDCVLEFVIDNQKYSFMFSIIRIRKDGYSKLVFTDKIKPNLNVYLKIKESLRAFLSFAFENTIQICEERFIENQMEINRFYSLQTIIKNKRPKFIPVNNLQFRKSFLEYMISFERFVLIDKDCPLKEVIYLINQAKQATIENATFLFIIVIEKIAFQYSQWKGQIHGDNTIISKDSFGKLFSNIIATFEKEFKDLKTEDIDKYNQLFSKLKNINYTDQKIASLFEYCEINLTEDLKALFPKFRNYAIHRGDIDYPVGSGFDNYKKLLYVCNTIIANLIQFKGARYIDHIGTEIYIEEKKHYKLEVTK